MQHALSILFVLFLVPCLAVAQQEAIESAMSAGPTSISADARILDWEMNELRAGDNGWTCLPDRPDTEGADPWCINGPWMDFLHAYMNKTEPKIESVGWAYMLMGDAPVSNTDPYATGPTDDNQWLEGVGAHLMILLPDRSAHDSISSDPHNGGPWVMWPNTPYAHIMVPMDSKHVMGHSMME